MDQAGYDQLRARTEALQSEVDGMLDNYQQQMDKIAAARDTLAVATAQGWSSDNLVRVTCSAAGVPIEVWVDPQAFKRSTPQKLGRSITEAAQAAARVAKKEIDGVMAPLRAASNIAVENPLGGDTPAFSTTLESILPPVPEGPEPTSSHAEPQQQASYGQQRAPQQPSYGQPAQPPAYGQPQPPAPSYGQPAPQQPAPSFGQTPRRPEPKPDYAPAWEDDEEGPHWKGW